LGFKEGLIERGSGVNNYFFEIKRSVSVENARNTGQELSKVGIKCNNATLLKASLSIILIFLPVLILIVVIISLILVNSSVFVTFLLTI
jgi:hypothetical protein